MISLDLVEGERETFFLRDSSVFLQECARPLLSDSQAPLYVLNIQERAEQLASQFQGKPLAPQVKLPLYFGSPRPAVLPPGRSRNAEFTLKICEVSSYKICVLVF